MTNMRRLVLAGAAAFTLAACERPDAEPQDSELVEGAAGVGAAVEDVGAGGLGVASANLPKTATEFVEAASIANLYEIRAAELAQTRAQSPRTREVAQRIITDHRALQDQLTSAVQSAGLQVSVPSQLDPRREEMISNLQGVSPADFDARYLEQQELAHQEALALMRGYAEGGDNPQLRQFAASGAPVIDQHLAMAREVENTLDQQPAGPGT